MIVKFALIRVRVLKMSSWGPQLWHHESIEAKKAKWLYDLHREEGNGRSDSEKD